jgi:transposase-like protein
VRGHVPTGEAVLKLLFLVLNLTAYEARMPTSEWAAAKAQKDVHLSVPPNRGKLPHGRLLW